MLLCTVIYQFGHEIPGFMKKSCIVVVGLWVASKSSAHDGHSIIGLGYKIGLRYLSTAVSVKSITLPQRVSSYPSNDREGGFILRDFSLLLNLG